MQDRPQTGKVVAVGSGKDLENNDVGMQVNVGDKVIFNKYTGAEVKFEDKNYILLVFLIFLIIYFNLS